MKNTRKLIPALAMLLLSAVLMSTASFAWFSMNTEVKATGMTVQATTPASLEIATTSDGAWTYDATLTTTKTGLNPVHYDSTTDKWYIPTDANKIKADGTPTTAFDATDDTNWKNVGLNYTTGNGTDSKVYAMVQDLYFRTNVGDSTDATAITFGATATKSGSSNLMPGVKVYIVDSMNAVTDITDAKAGTWTAPLSSATPGYIKLTVVVVYDGTNAAVKNDNADLVNTQIAIDFAKN